MASPLSAEALRIERTFALLEKRVIAAESAPVPHYKDTRASKLDYGTKNLPGYPALADRVFAHQLTPPKDPLKALFHEHHETPMDAQAITQVINFSAAILKIRDLLLHELSHFDFRAHIRGLPIAEAEYFEDLKFSKRFAEYQRVVGERFVAAVNSRLSRYERRETVLNEAGVFDAESNAQRVKALALADMGRPGSTLHLPTLCLEAIQHMMRHDGLLEAAKEVEKPWLGHSPGRRASASGSGTGDSSGSPHHQSPHSHDHRQHVHIEEDGDEQHYQRVDSPAHSTRTGGGVGSVSVTSADRIRRPSSLPSLPPPPVETHDSFWGKRHTNFGGRGRSSDDDALMKRVWAAERGVVATASSLRNSLAAALDANGLRMLDTPVSVVHSVHAPSDLAEAEAKAKYPHMKDDKKVLDAAELASTQLHKRVTIGVAAHAVEAAAANAAAAGADEAAKHAPAEVEEERGMASLYALMQADKMKTYFADKRAAMEQELAALEASGHTRGTARQQQLALVASMQSQRKAQKSIARRNADANHHLERDTSGTDGVLAPQAAAELVGFTLAHRVGSTDSGAGDVTAQIQQTKALSEDSDNASTQQDAKDSGAPSGDAPATAEVADAAGTLKPQVPQAQYLGSVEPVHGVHLRVSHPGPSLLYFVSDNRVQPELPPNGTMSSAGIERGSLVPLLPLVHREGEATVTESTSTDANASTARSGASEGGAIEVANATGIADQTTEGQSTSPPALSVRRSSRRGSAASLTSVRSAKTSGSGRKLHHVGTHSTLGESHHHHHHHHSRHVGPQIEAADFTFALVPRAVNLAPTAAYNGVTSVDGQSKKPPTRGRDRGIPPVPAPPAVTAPVFSRADVAKSLRHAQAPATQVDTQDIHAHTRHAKRSPGAPPRPTTPESLRQSQEEATLAAHSHGGSSARRWYEGQGFAPGRSLQQVGSTTVSSLVGPVLAQRLEAEAGVQLPGHLQLHRTISRQSGRGTAKFTSDAEVLPPMSPIRGWRPGVTTSLNKLHATLDYSARLPVGVQTRIQALGKTNAEKPIPIQLSPVRPARAVSMRRAQKQFESIALAAAGVFQKPMPVSARARTSSARADTTRSDADVTTLSMSVDVTAAHL